ncbi:alpha/beta fold hydrolase [Paraburkholderia sp. CNPSo 3157]|uniref:Alpha/beta fold hydrolase n=1 Tax=Paraburkholderia franconis TaxID=2654983 RepID=A0A7X1NHW2_9BURK|nr:alpha/beta hydrolase [Paraburkholderia franconis]MPW22224.1 alpha/beta fold hydrolase [Paraburkholderia franconis]
MSHSTFCEIPAGRIAYSRRGSGRPLVLLHPIGVDRSWWDEHVEHWAASYDVVAIDIRGHGQSSAVTAPITLADHAADVAAVLRQERLTGATLIGVSMGGMIAQRVAIQFPALVGALILCGTAGGFRDEVRPHILARGDMSRQGSMSEVIDETIARWFLTDTPRPDLVQKCRERLAADDWYSWSANWRAISLLDNLGELPNVSAPALVVAGGADASIPPAVSQKIADALPHSRFVVVPGAAHFGAFDMRADFAAIFDDFLSTLTE